MVKKKIEYLLFDLGNVFIYWNKEPFLQTVIDDMPNKNIHSSEYSSPFWIDLISYESDLEKGQLNWNQFCEAIKLKYEWKGCSDALLKSFQDIFEPNQILIDWFLRTDFKASTFLVSNTNVYHWRWISKHYADLLSKFDHLYLSHEVGFRKPNKEYYLRCLDRSNWSKSLIVDDLKENLKIPRELGADAHHFKDNESLWRHLDQCAF